MQFCHSRRLPMAALEGLKMKNDPSEETRTHYTGDEPHGIKLDKEFETLIPPLSSGELAELHKSLDKDGCRDDLIGWKDHNTLVDGHNRIKYCPEKKIPFDVIWKEFRDKAEVKEYIRDAQLGRRNLSPVAESCLRGERYLEMKRQGERKDLTSGQTDQKTTAQKLAEKFGGSDTTIRRDAKIAEAVDKIMKNCGPDAKKLILSKDLRLTRGDVRRLARLEPDEQKKFIKELEKNGKPPRKARKRKKAKTINNVPTQPKALVQALAERLSRHLAEIYKELGKEIKRRSAKSKNQEKSKPAQPRKEKAKK